MPTRATTLTTHASRPGIFARGGLSRLGGWQFTGKATTMSARKHGHSNTRLYNTWRGMIGRCKHSTNRHYERYGGRGISVCDAWHDASTFIAWALANGWESGLEIDRIDNDGDYCPDNCRFVTSKENSRNTRRNVFITYLGETMCISAWADRTGLHKKTIETRLGRYGWTVEQTLTLPLQKGKRP